MTTDPFAPKPNSTKVATKWALINTGVAIVFTFLFQFLAIDPQSSASYINYVPFIAFLILTQVEFKKQLGGSLTYGQAFSAGFRYALFTGILTAIFMFIYISFINKGFTEQIMEASRAKLEAKGMSDEQVEQAMAISSKMMGPAMFSFFAAVGSAFLGTIVSLITSAIVKKDPSPFDPSDYKEPVV